MKDYAIIEEVPGVPVNERFFIREPNFLDVWNRGEVKHFATREEAENYLLSIGINEYDFESFHE